MAQDLRKSMESEMKNVKIYQKEYNSLNERRQLLNGQLNESEVVQGELDFLKENDEVFKLVGPVLMKQNISDAKVNVSKRITFIRGEMKRIGSAIKIAEVKLKESKEKLQKMQETLKKEGKSKK